jgi:hypothetical protein
MVFKPNYRRDRLNDRRRQAHGAQRKKDEKVVLRKAERDAAEAPPDDKQS